MTARTVVGEALAAIREQDWERLRPLLHPYVHWTDATARSIRGRTNVLEHLASGQPVNRPARYELRDGQIYRWIQGREDE